MRGFLKQFAPDVFRPEEISILEDALDDAWRRIESSKAPWASDDYSAVGRTILAKYIITMAKGGERDAKMVGGQCGPVPVSEKTNSPNARSTLTGEALVLQPIP